MVTIGVLGADILSTIRHLLHSLRWRYVGGEETVAAVLAVPLTHVGGRTRSVKLRCGEILNGLSQKWETI